MARETGARGTSARQAILDLLPPLPRGWQLVTDEARLDGDSVRVRVSIREIAPSDTGDARQHRITAKVTVTVPEVDRARAEDRLDDAMDEWLFLLDAAELPWESATKGFYADEGNRLGFQFDINDIRTTPTEEDPTDG